jgi:hypothetical protein
MRAQAAAAVLPVRSAMSRAAMKAMVIAGRRELGKDRKEVVDLFEIMRRRAVAERDRAHLQVFQHGHFGQRLPPSGDCSKPSRDTRPGAMRAILPPSNRIEPAVGRTMPLRQLSSVDLPAPLGPERATISPASTWKETPQRPDAAVGGREVLDDEHPVSSRDRR